jgi:hypothetical protein
VVAPPTFFRLVTKFTTPMANWPESNYGQIASRAVAPLIASSDERGMAP